MFVHDTVYLRRTAKVALPFIGDRHKGVAPYLMLIGSVGSHREVIVGRSTFFHSADTTKTDTTKIEF